MIKNRAILRTEKNVLGNSLKCLRKDYYIHIFLSNLETESKCRKGLLYTSIAISSNLQFVIYSDRNYSFIVCQFFLWLTKKFFYCEKTKDYAKFISCNSFSYTLFYLSMFLVFLRFSGLTQFLGSFLPTSNFQTI